MKPAALLCSLSCALWAAPARAQAPPPRAPSGAIFRTDDTPPPATPPAHVAVRLDYTRGPGTDACPDQLGVRGALSAQFGYDPTAPGAAARLLVAVSREGGELRVELSAYDAAGRARWADHVESRGDCARLLATAVFMVRIGIDALPEPLSAPPPPPGPSVEPPPPPLPLPPLPPPAAPPSERPKVRVGLGAAVAFELAPNTAAYLAAEVGLRWTYASLSAEGRYALPVTDKEGGFETSVAAGALVGCGHYGIGVACGVFAAGSRHAATLDGASSTSGLYLGAGGRLGIEIPFAQRFAIRIAGELLGTVKPWTVRINGMPRWTTPAGAGGLGGGLLAHF